jgi:predicted Rdx family selenoprotein
MQDVTRFSSNPIAVQKSVRVDNARILTSGDAGVIQPISFIPLLREDAVTSGRIDISVEMMETAEMLMNSIYVEANAYFVPYLAFDRFTGMDSLNRSFMKVKEREADAAPVPFINSAVYGTHGSNEIYKALGLHHRSDKQVNLAVVEAYNEMVNFRRKQRSQSLPLRNATDTTLAEAFWNHQGLKHIVPDFDQARIDGEVALNVVSNAMPVQSPSTGALSVEVNGVARSLEYNSNPNYIAASNNQNGSSAAELFVELEQNGITVSLANIEIAKQTAAFARLREQYQGHSDDYIIDLLMEGVRIPEQNMKEPILMAKRSTVVGYTRRYATDGANLDKSATNGATMLSLPLRLPPVNTGGVIIVTVETTPEQLWERKKDYFFDTVDQDKWPQYLRDYLDPEKVDVVPNEHVDVDHSTPDGTFGYAPLNHVWQRDFARIGGKYFRPEVDGAFDEDRQKIWAVETVDPQLTADFYLCTNLHKKVFADSNSDSFEYMARQNTMISGNTVFGAMLTEATDDYDKVSEKVDLTRIEKA